MGRIETATDRTADGRSPDARRERIRTVGALVALSFVLTACPSTTETPAGSAATTTLAPSGSTAPPDSPTTTAPGAADAPTSAPPVATTAATTASSAAGPQRNPGNQYTYGLYERVNFRPGTSGITISDGAPRGTVSGYLFGAAAGQKFTLNLVSVNGSFDVYAPDDTPLATDVTYAEISPLPADGDYLVVVGSAFGGGVGYDLITSITSPSAAPGRSANCNEYVEFQTETRSDYPMRLCHKGDLVREVQQALEDAGFDVDVDGFYGPGTEAAVRAFFGDGIGVLYPPDIESLIPFDE